jgi:hypothetical protein
VISSNVGILAEVAVGCGAVDRFGKIDSEVGIRPDLLLSASTTPPVAP